MQARAARSDGWRGETDTAEKIERRVASNSKWSGLGWSFLFS